ncbi:putative lipid II flippase FtsW [Brachybacterium saurashtrense]|uniref:Probable peptidoglycan glycosyltransferase FtsW n=1 Tax=Brachybacterium saurashtrense TaxID=556288 RepID=A0A345YL33_9MICO|nr:putative lipid II flippase FtsW [Brachybacterium saurashtrense]AXK44635.1 putative lipid II flippase FtsW [Brachybacterium saurashtrense]RRR23247.1 putative lipid II flippase FtsW [Brachybacterium saurashtrense]
MTVEDTRTGSRPAARRSTGVIRPDEEQPLGNIGGRVRDGVAGWLKSPALDFYGLIVIGTLLVSVGLVMVLSSSAVLNISRGNSGFAGLFRQGTFAGLGLVLLVVAAMLPPGFYRRAAWPLLGVGLALQCLVFVPGLGWAVDGNQNWIRIGGQTFQPSEFLKLALAVWIGALLAMKRPLLHRPAHLLFPLAPGVLLALGLVMLGHDLGTMLIMAMLVAGAVWVGGVPRRWFAAAGAAAVLGILALTVTSSNRMARITNWIHGICEGDSCYQSDQGLMGLAEGGWWGVGLGESRQKWGRLPAAEDDYIFAIIGEELGLIGTLGVLALFSALALIMFRMITRLDDHFMQISVAGISAWLLGQAFVNMMVVTGLLPVIGVPLPFISSGGSALLASMTALGVLLSFARREPGASEAIGARVSAVRNSISVLPAPRRRAAASSGATGSSRPARSSRSRRSGRGASSSRRS